MAVSVNTLVKKFIEKNTKYILHIALPNIQYSRIVVVIRNGRLNRNRTSDTARFNMYRFVTVFILENLNTT
jgi:hypothetical protein